MSDTTTQAEASESRISKIEKLLAKANRAGTPEESEAFFAKAQELMTKWAIDEAVVMSRQGRGVGEEPITEAIIIKRSGYFDVNVQLMLASSLANDVKLLVRRPQAWGSEAGVLLVGFKSDIERAKLLYTSLLIQVTRERQRQLPTYLKGDQTGTGKWRVSFSIGYAGRIHERLQEQKRLTEDEATKSDGSLLPVLASKQDRLNEFYDGLSKGKAVARRSRTADWDGIIAGQRAANSADLGNTRVGGQRKELGQ